VEDVKYLMEYTGGARNSGMSSWAGRQSLEAHYELNNKIGYSVIPKPRAKKSDESAKKKAPKDLSAPRVVKFLKK
jgi:hypothetical protein